MDERAQRTIEAAEEIYKLLKSREIPCAVIGAMALAVHGYQRATVDFDFGVVGDPFGQLAELARELKESGYQTELITPDSDDPLGGVLTISRDDIDPIQLVNFYNPLSPSAGAVGRSAVSRAQKNSELPFQVVTIEDLVALKLYAGGLQSKADVLRLLQEKPAAIIESIKAVASEFGLSDELDEVLKEL